MGCCCTEDIVAALKDVASELRKIRLLHWPLPTPTQWPKAIGRTIQTGKEYDEMKKTFITYEQDVAPLPAAEGRNKDIDHAILIVVADEVEVERHNVEFDLESRAPKGPVAWKAPKGSSVTLRYGYADDDHNVSELVNFPYGIAADTISPDAPTEGAVGAARVVGEVEVDVPDEEPAPEV